MPLHTKVKARRRVLHYPFTHAVPVAMFFSAVNASLYFETLGPISTGLLLLFAGAGCLMVIAGLQWRGDAAASYIIERTGQSICIGAWIINFYLLWLLSATPLAFMTPLIFIVASVLRIVSLRRDINLVEKVQRARIEKARGESV